MAGPRESIHGQWSSRWVFILAATGSAIGLGNIWRFPYITGENGGGAFVLIYLLCVAAVGIPIMMAETLIGRRGRRSPINSMRALAEEEGLSSNWRYLGWLGVAAGFLILSFYSVVAGWSVAYIFYVGGGVFADATVEASGAQFEALTAVGLAFIVHGHDRLCRRPRGAGRARKSGKMVNARLVRITHRHRCLCHCDR